LHQSISGSGADLLHRCGQSLELVCRFHTASLPIAVATCSARPWPTAALGSCRAPRAYTNEALLLSGPRAPLMVAAAYNVRHRRKSAYRHPFAIRGHPLKLPRCIHNMPSSFSFCRIALAPVDAEHLVAVGVPELTAAAFIVVAVDQGELPKATSRHIVKWGPFLAW